MPDHFVKVLLIGESGSGKSSLVNRLSRNEFDPLIRSTGESVCGDFAQLTAEIDGEQVTGELWGINGKGVESHRIGAWYGNGYHCPNEKSEEKYRSSATLVYDICDRKSYESIIKWLTSHPGLRPIVGVLVGNKCDLPKERAVSTEEAQALADRNGFNFIETSALDGTRVAHAFPPIIWEIWLRNRLSFTQESMYSEEKAALGDHFLQMYLRGDFTDFTVIGSDGVRLRAHRCVLMARSDVLRSMLTHRTKEVTKRCCKITDTDGATLDMLLRYMYGCCVAKMEGCQAEHLLAAAGKYAVDGLFRACQDYLIREMNVHNAGRFLILADLHSALDLKEVALFYIARHLAEFVRLGGREELADYGQGLPEELETFCRMVDGRRGHNAVAGVPKVDQ